MKKKVWRLLSLVIAVVLALSMTVFAEGKLSITISGVSSTQTLDGEMITSYVEDGVIIVNADADEFSEGEESIDAVQSDAVYTFDKVVGTPGEVVKVNVYFKTAKAASLAAIGGIAYDKENLEFVSFNYDSSVAELINLELSGFDVETMSVVTLFNEEKEYDVCLGTLNFKIKDEITYHVDSSEEDEFMSDERKQNVICMMIDKPMTITHGKKQMIDSENSLVTPYITNNRTMVPLRFISENLGAEVLWEEGWDGCVIKKDGKEIAFTFGSAEFTVNGEKLTFDAPIEMLHDRTMVPVRFVSEQLGYDVYWENINRAVVISPAENPWQEGRKAETRAINEMLISILGIL